jgi:hypothetical protein
MIEKIAGEDMDLGIMSQAMEVIKGRIGFLINRCRPSMKTIKPLSLSFLFC